MSLFKLFPEIPKKLSCEVEAYIEAMQRNWDKACKHFEKRIIQLEKQNKEL